MSPREALIFERALWMCAHDQGYTREQMLEWLNRDDDWKNERDYPKDCLIGLIDGKPPFIQVTRTTHVPHAFDPPNQTVD